MPEVYHSLKQCYDELNKKQSGTEESPKLYPRSNKK